MGTDPDDKVLDPFEEAELDERLSVVREEKRMALKDPGPSWREWFFFDAAKWWIGLLFFIVDTWIAGFWVEQGTFLAIAPSIAVAIYAEFLLFRFLWYRPTGEEPRRAGVFRRSWLHPVPYGRWTPEAARARMGIDPIRTEGGPDPREFV